MVFVATVLTAILAVAALAVLRTQLRQAWPFFAQLRKDLAATPATVTVRYTIRTAAPSDSRTEPLLALRRADSVQRRARRLVLKRKGRLLRPAARAA